MTTFEAAEKILKELQEDLEEVKSLTEEIDDNYVTHENLSQMRAEIEESTNTKMRDAILEIAEHLGVGITLPKVDKLRKYP